MLRQGIANTKKALHPWISKTGTFSDELRDASKVGGSPGLGVPLDISPEHANLLGP